MTLPGTGLTNRRKIDTAAGPQTVQPASHWPPTYLSPGTNSSYLAKEEIFSASTEMLNSASLEPLRKLLREAYEERGAITQELSAAENEYATARERYISWQKGLLLKRIRQSSFAARKEASKTAEAKRDELKEQLRLTTLAAEISVDQEQAEPYYRMRDEFASLTGSNKIWDTLDRRTVDQMKERSAANESITREPVVFDLGGCDLLHWNQKVPHLANKTGGDLYLYPGFVLYRASIQAFALIDFRDIYLTYKPQRFIEDETVPSDSQVVDRVWDKCNKDGTPDRRFRDNREIPVAIYGKIMFSSASGLQEEYLVSNSGLAERFTKAWSRFHQSFTSDTNSIH